MNDMHPPPLWKHDEPVLMTGFEPFGGAESNPTCALMERLGDLQCPALVTAVLPTAYARGADVLLELLHQVRPRWLVMTGLNATASHLRYEQVALNLDHSSKPDNDGEVRQFRRIQEPGPVGFWNGLPFELLQTTAAEHGEELELSRDAGGFVCNHVYFTALECLSTRFSGTRGGFIHVPPLSPGRLYGMVRLFHRFANCLSTPPGSIDHPSHTHRT